MSDRELRTHQSAKCSQYKGKFVAFINGKLIAAEEDNSKIKEAIQNYLSKNPQYEKESRFIKKVTQEVLNRVIEFS